MRAWLVVPVWMSLWVGLAAPRVARRAASQPATTHHAAQQAPAQKAVPQAPVTLRGKTLFSVAGVLSFPAAARAAAISRRLEDLTRDRTFQPGSLTVSDAVQASDIMAGDLIVMSVTDEDAQAAGTTRQALARDYAGTIGSAMVAARHHNNLRSLLLGATVALVASVLLFWFWRLLGWSVAKLAATLEGWRGTRIRSLRIQRFELLPADRIAGFAIALVRLVRFLLVLISFYVYASVVLGSFPWTRGYARELLKYVLAPLRMVGRQAASYLPNLFFIAVIAVISYYSIRFVRVIFTEIGKGTITLPDFYPEWAGPTYKIVRFMILALTVVVVFPYLPGSKSPAFQGVSIFLGVLISLGSTSAVANVVAGVILTYMRAFKVGDRVKIADTVGDVIEKTLLVTRIQTIKNVEITIANAMVLNSHIFNYSASAREEGLILHTSVTIGYDAPWRMVHQLLIDAALACEDVLQEPRPFVLQTALDDFYVHYQINAYTRQPQKMAQAYSELYQQIQDKFNAAGVEIMSSHYTNVRDGNRTTIPEEYVGKEYEAPHFRVGLAEATEPLAAIAKAETHGD